MKKASIKDIAKHLNVSVSTVSLTLNGRGDEKRISKDTQKKIIAYATTEYHIIAVLFGFLFYSSGNARVKTIRDIRHNQANGITTPLF